MRFKIQCVDCGSTAWVSGIDEPDTNCISIDLDKIPEWEGPGSETCPHSGEIATLDMEEEDEPD